MRVRCILRAAFISEGRAYEAPNTKFNRFMTAFFTSLKKKYEFVWQSNYAGTRYRDQFQFYYYHCLIEYAGYASGYSVNFQKHGTVASADGITTTTEVAISHRHLEIQRRRYQKRGITLTFITK